MCKDRRYAAVEEGREKFAAKCDVNPCSRKRISIFWNGGGIPACYKWCHSYSRKRNSNSCNGD